MSMRRTARLASLPIGSTFGRPTVVDVFYIALGLGFFGLAALYAIACDRL